MIYLKFPKPSEIQDKNTPSQRYTCAISSLPPSLFLSFVFTRSSEIKLKVADWRRRDRRTITNLNRNLKSRRGRREYLESAKETAARSVRQNLISPFSRALRHVGELKLKTLN